VFMPLNILFNVQNRQSMFRRIFYKRIWVLPF